jgi:hypothetical protein
VVARENSSVVARENSSVVARENSSVVAWGNSGVHASSTSVKVEIFGFAVAWDHAKAKIRKRAKTATVITPESASGTKGWLETNAIREKGGKVVLFKRVSKDFRTQEGTPNETTWAIGATLEHPNWRPKSGECGDGKFHAVSRPYFGDEFRSTHMDRYIAVQIAVADLYAWPNPKYPHKIGFRKGCVLYEVDRMGRKTNGSAV